MLGCNIPYCLGSCGMLIVTGDGMEYCVVIGVLLDDKCDRRCDVILCRVYRFRDENCGRRCNVIFCRIWRLV